MSMNAALGTKDVQTYAMPNDCASTSLSHFPKRKLLPVSMFTNVTAAGLKR
jgi:hypothetical protein